MMESLRECEGCGVLEIFAPLERIPPVLILVHPMDNTSRAGGWQCGDKRECIRRSRMKMKPGAGLIWGHESISHVLIECKSCGSPRTAQGIRERWVEGDPFPVHQYVCSSCGAVHAEARWTDLPMTHKV